MSTTTFGSAATAIRVSVMTNAEQVERFDVDEDTAEPPSLVLEDGSSCLAYFIDGDPQAWRDLAARIVAAVDATVPPQWLIYDNSKGAVVETWSHEPVGIQAGLLAAAGFSWVKAP